MTYRNLLRVVGVVALSLSAGSIARPEILEQVLVKVNGEIFTKSDLETKQVQEIRQRGKQIDLSTAQGNDEQYKQILDNLKTQNKIENDEQLVAALKQENMTMADLRKNLERTVIAQRVQQAEVFGKVAITDTEAHKYYDTHMAEFTTPSTVMVREILINVPADTRGINVAADDAA